MEKIVYIGYRDPVTVIDYEQIYNDTHQRHENRCFQDCGSFA
jgi:hypothetical protein